MAEKSSELKNIKMIDTDSVEDKSTGDNSSLQTRADDNQSTDLETRGADEAAIGDGESATADTEQLRDQIEETRRGMSETIDAIQEKLSFSNISEQVKDQVSGQISDAVETAKDAFYGKAGDIVNTVGRSFRQLGGTDLAKRAQENPTALAIIGAGIGALLVGVLLGGDSKKSKKKNTSYRYKNNNASYKYDFDSDDNDVRYADSPRRELKSNKSVKSGAQQAPSKTGDTASTAYQTASSAASTALEGVASSASSVSETVGSIASKTYEGAGSAASKTFETVGGAASFAYDKAGDLGGQMKINYDYYIEENPLAVGAVALALGAAVGFAIPLTKTENEYLGEYRDNVLEKAQTTAQDALGTVKQMATEAQKAITDEVRSKTA
jgi:ElaB/YqjD/DUF883 family membrane-anchored ribosome-binding protein